MAELPIFSWLSDFLIFRTTMKAKRRSGSLWPP